MINTKRILKIMLISIITVALLSSYANAATIQVTDENLDEAVQRYAQSELNENNETFTVKNNVIKVEDENDGYEIKYDLTQNPTFTIEIPIQNGMSYEKYNAETEKINNISIGYLSVANIQGVNFIDAYMYYALAYLENFNGSYSTENSVVIIDDTVGGDGITIEKTDNPKTFYVSDFPDRVMDYINYMYQEETVINDSTELNSFEVTIKKQDVTETSCNLVATLSVNLDADFSTLNGITDEMKESFMDNGITKENADYEITLKVGQKCKIETSKDFNGYELYGGCVEIDKELAEITAIETGNANGYFYVGDEKKSFYITVEENPENATLETITLKIEEKTDTGPSTENVENEFVVKVPGDTTEKDDTVTNATEIPKAGRNKGILCIIASFAILQTVMSRKVKKYKGI